MTLNRSFSILAAVLILALATACGKKGPLYLPPSGADITTIEKQVETEKKKTDNSSSQQSQ